MLEDFESAGGGGWEEVSEVDREILSLGGGMGDVKSGRKRLKAMDIAIEAYVGLRWSCLREVVIERFE